MWLMHRSPPLRTPFAQHSSISLTFALRYVVHALQHLIQVELCSGLSQMEPTT